jgi:polyhydroxyalkanoate synthesis repressor PhaR
MTEAEQNIGDVAASGEPRIVKRYSNRKLYDTVKSRYVTLEEVAQLIKGGLEVKILDNRTKDDLTAVTLAQIIFEEEKKRARMPLDVLRDIIRHGGEALTGFLHEQVGPRVATIREEAEVLRDRLLGRDAEERSSGAAPGKLRALEHAKDLIGQSRRVLEDWRKQLDERVHQAVEGITSLPALGRDLASFEKKIADIEKKLDEMEKQGGARPPG